MNFELKPLAKTPLTQMKTPALAVCVSAQGLPKSHPLHALWADAVKSKAFEGKAGQLLSVWRPQGLTCERLVLIGTAAQTPADWQKAMQRLAAWAKEQTVTKASVALDAKTRAQWLSVMRPLADANYTYTHTKPSAKPHVVAWTFCVPDVAKVKASVAQVQAALVGVALAREWGNRPGNHATPTHLAQAAKALGKLKQVSCEVLSPSQIAKLNMGAFLAVAQASAQPPAFIVLKYQGAAASEAPTVLVGKGITFDTGGISLKPGAGMDEMKFDMCGAASVLGTFRALAELQPKINVVGLIPACENMPGGKAVKPGDVVTSASGQTIEILNTDAEGRLILSDALWYASRFKPRAVIDIATLTGACVIALGHVRSGLYATEDALANQLLQAGEDWDDLCWRMPLDDAYAEGLKSNFADVANVADRAAGSVTAAKFLQRFAPGVPWAHLDIAGSAWKSGGAKGATGRPVGLLLGYLLSQIERR